MSCQEDLADAYVGVDSDTTLRITSLRVRQIMRADPEFAAALAKVPRGDGKTLADLYDHHEDSALDGCFAHRIYDFHRHRVRQRIWPQLEWSTRARVVYREFPYPYGALIGLGIGARLLFR
jgi:hypothetical protein